MKKKQSKKSRDSVTSFLLWFFHQKNFLQSIVHAKKGFLICRMFKDLFVSIINIPVYSPLGGVETSWCIRQLGVVTPRCIHHRHSWALASRKLMPASAFRHPKFQTGTGLNKRWTASAYCSPVPDRFRQRQFFSVRYQTDAMPDSPAFRHFYIYVNGH